MKTRVLLIALLSATTLAACGGDDEEPAPSDNGGAATAAPDSGGGGGGGGSETLSITAQEPFAFDPAELEAAAGEVTIEMESPSDLQAPHAVEIEGNGVEEVGRDGRAGRHQHGDAPSSRRASTRTTARSATTGPGHGGHADRTLRGVTERRLSPGALERARRSGCTAPRGR